MIARRRLMIAGALLPAWAVLAQQAKLFRIGVLETTPIEGNANFEEFRRTLRSRGYQNLAFEYRSSYGRNDRFAELAAELVRLNVDLILTRGTAASLAAKAASRTIPIVSVAVSDPVRSGLAVSLARPGGNFTGFEPFATDLIGKRFELLKEVLPGVTRIGRMADRSNPAYSSGFWKESEAKARSLGLEPHLFDVRKSADIASAIEAAAKLQVSGFTVSIDGVMSANREAIVQLLARHRIPAMYGSRDFVEAGGLMSYSVDYLALYARAATYVDRIFKGANPGDLPIEQATKFELVINLKTAKALGIKIPTSALLRADKVIE